MKMEYLINNSLIIGYIYKLLMFVKNKFKDSLIYGLSISFVKKIQYYLSYSKIWNYLKRPDYLDTIWRNSFIYRVLDKCLNGPIIFFRKFYLKYEEAFSYSYIFKFIKFLVSRFEIVIGLTLIFTFIIPDHRWYNIYGVLFTLILLILFIIKIIIEPAKSIDIFHLDFSLVLFFATITLATVTSLFPRESINYFIYYLISFITVIIIISSIDSTDELNRLIELLLMGTFLTVLYGIWQWKVVGIEVNPSLTDLTVNQSMSGRVFSTMGNPNIYGELLVLTMPFLGTVFFNSKSWWKKAFILCISLPIVVILLKTGSRSAWVSFAFAMFIFVFFKNKKLLPFMILIGILCIPILPQSIYRRILTIFNPNDSSIKYRKQILEPAIPMLKNYWLGGVGLGNQVFNTIYKRYKSFALKTVAHTHNLYLQLWLEAGILALGSFILLIFRLFKKSMVLIFNKKDDSINNILIACISGIGGLMVMGFADHVWFYNRILFLFFIVVGICLCGLKLLNKQEEKK